MSTEGFRYEVVAEDGPARAGRFITPHAVIETPVFMPVGTQATVKTQPFPGPNLKLIIILLMQRIKQNAKNHPILMVR